MQKAEITSYSVIDLLSWQESGALAISPKFQRRSVWNTPAKGFFVESVLLDYPIPPVHIRLAKDGGRTVREVIDGQQRMRAVFDFIAGKYRIPPSVSDQWGGKTYARLTDDEREAINLFSFTVYQYKQLSDSDVLDMFARLNTYSVSLNAQELRNGRWFGRFKQTSYRLAAESLEFWRQNRVFNESQIARMREVEFVSELLILCMDGMQDKKASVDVFYENLDEAWSRPAVNWKTVVGSRTRTQPMRYLTETQCMDRFRETLSLIETMLGDLLPLSPFRRPALFYTLFAAIHQLRYGLPHQMRAPLYKAGISNRLRESIRQSASELADVFDDAGRSGPANLRRFFEASTRQTDNIQPREERLRALLKAIS